MSFDPSPSPVTPGASSRLWTTGASGGLAVLILLILAAFRPELAGWLLVGSAAVAFTTWMSARRQGATAQGVQTSVAQADHAPAQLLDGVFEALNDPLLIISGGEADDIAGRRIVMANAAARDLLRVPPDGGLLVSFVRDPGLLEIVDEALFGGVTRTADYAAGGTKDRHWRAWVTPLQSTPDRSLALLTLRDETDVRRMELMRVDFLANASHELRTPLASLSGFIETLKGHARDDPAARDRFLDIMSTQATRMSRLVADLLSLSRIELNEHIPPSGRVDLSLAASDVVDAISLLAQAREVGTALLGERRGVVIDGDRDEILQVIQNLVDNGIKYSPPKQAVEILIRTGLTLDAAPGLRREGATRLSLLTPDREAGVLYASVSVRDHGPGMAREHLPRLTERFYRVEGQKSGDRPGTGLGLAIVKHIVNRHRGGLVVESAPDEGASFTAYFPLAARQRHAAGSPETGSPSS